MQVVNALVKIISAIPIISNADVIPARNEGRFAVGSILGGEAFSCLPLSKEGEENGFTVIEVGSYLTNLPVFWSWTSPKAWSACAGERSVFRSCAASV